MITILIIGGLLAVALLFSIVHPKIPVHLIPDWRGAWKLLSVNAMGWSVAMIGSWSAMPEKMQEAIPIQWVLALAMVLLVLGIIGRVIQQPVTDPTVAAEKAGDKP